MWDQNNNDGKFCCKIKSAFKSVFSHNRSDNSQVVRKADAAPKQSSAVTQNKMQAQNKEADQDGSNTDKSKVAGSEKRVGGVDGDDIIDVKAFNVLKNQNKVDVEDTANSELSTVLQKRAENNEIPEADKIAALIKDDLKLKIV